MILRLQVHACRCIGVAPFGGGVGALPQQQLAQSLPQGGSPQQLTQGLPVASPVPQGLPSTDGLGKSLRSCKTEAALEVRVPLLKSLRLPPKFVDYGPGHVLTRY